MDKLALSIAEAVERSGLGRTSLHCAIGNGELQARKRGRRTTVLARDLERYLESLPKAIAPAGVQPPHEPK